MIAKRSLFSLIVFSCIVLCGLGFYFIYVRELVSMAYHDQAPKWFNDLIVNLYPRFFVEKKRFDLAFFLDKSDQIIIRFIFISLLIALYQIFKATNFYLFQNTKNLYSGVTSSTNVTILRILYFSVVILIYYDIYWVLIDLSHAKIFYKPIALLKLLHLNFPADPTIAIICVLLAISCLMGIFNILPTINSIIVIVLLIYIQGLLFSFEKIDHGFAPITYAGMILPFLLYESSISKVKQTKEVNVWPLRLIQTLICLCYLFSGLEKVFISKLQWINPETFKTYLLLHSAPLGLSISSNTFLCTLLPTIALLFQLGFVTVLFNKKLKYIFLPLGILFHIGSYLLFDVGGFMHPWLLTYFFFINWDSLLLSKSMKISTP